MESKDTEVFTKELEKALQEYDIDGNEYLISYDEREFPITLQIYEAADNKGGTHDDFVLAEVNRDEYYDNILDYLFSPEFVNLLNDKIGYRAIKEIKINHRETEKLNENTFIIRTANKDEKENLLRLNKKAPNAYITGIRLFFKSPDDSEYLTDESVNVTLTLDGVVSCCGKNKKLEDMLMVSTQWEPVVSYEFEGKEREEK